MDQRSRISSFHECDPLSCGLQYDPSCPVWGGVGALPWSPTTVAEFEATLLSPTYRRQLAKVLIAVLAPEIGRIVADLQRRASK